MQNYSAPTSHFSIILSACKSTFVNGELKQIFPQKVNFLSHKEILIYIREMWHFFFFLLLIWTVMSVICTALKACEIYWNKPPKSIIVWTYSSTSLKQTPSGSKKCVCRYKEVSAKKRFPMRFLINPFPEKVSVIRRCPL